MSGEAINHDKIGAPHLAFLQNTTGDPAIDADLEYIQSLDWSKSSVGSISSWPPELLVLINLAMLSPQPQLFLLGPDSIILYNTAYGRLIRDHHPLYQGRPISLDTALVAQAPAIDRIVGRAETREKPANENRVPFLFLSNGRLEEVFLSATMVKLPLSLGGFHATTYDTTSDTVQARRDLSLNTVLDHTSSAEDLPSLWSSILAGISAADGEISFAVLYSAHTELINRAQTDSVYRKVDARRFRLEGTVGDFAIAPPNEIDLGADDSWIQQLNKAAKTRAPVVLGTQDGNLPDNFCQAARKRCYGDDCREAVILTSALDAAAELHGLLIVGLAPCRPYDEVYKSWIRMFHRNVANLVASITISEARALARQNESKRAARERDILAKELMLREKEAALATGKIRRMHEIMQSANVGIFECKPSGELIQANKSFSHLSGCRLNLDDGERLTIMELSAPNKNPTLTEHWARLVAGDSHTFTICFQLIDENVRWVQAACMPVINDEHIVESITGCITDITAQKNAEQEAIKRAQTLEQLRLSEARLLEEAIEAKRQQENFVDMTSHEIRNPLGVVFHCTDSMLQTLADMKTVIDKAITPDGISGNQVTNARRLQELHQDIRDTVDTIMSCTMHQKRITDDILSLSKLDSNLLEICPSTFNAEEFLHQVHSNFAAEAARASIALNTVHDSSIDALGIEWIKADPGRLMQVLVNLVANAIKFTKSQPFKRDVNISIGASKSSSISVMEELIIAGSSAANGVELASAKDNAFFLWFKVNDTGCGMDAAEKARIFSRFSQASPKTYNTYGGSGLGLFISQKLVALQGGKIGFSSESGSGSTFAFFVKAYKIIPTEEPRSDLPLIPSKQGVDVVSDKSADGVTSQTSVLLVEDNLINQKVLKQQLIRHGFLVHTADNGQDAFDFIRRSQHWTRSHLKDALLPMIDIILMDVEMPIMNGLDCANMIRQAEQNEDIDTHIPIIAVTANARPEQLRRAIEVGMDDAISKPFRVRDLTPMVERLCKIGSTPPPKRRKI